MNSITMTVELSAEDRARLDKIIEALSGAKPAARPAEIEGQMTFDDITPAPEPEAPAAPEPEAPAAPEPEKQTEPDAPAVTHADIQRKVVELSAAGKKDQVREIVTKYAKKVSDLPEDKLGEVWAKLTALGEK